MEDSESDIYGSEDNSNQGGSDSDSDGSGPDY
jgi:hypothetical protein